jgi:hypothetical protein
VLLEEFTHDAPFIKLDLVQLLEYLVLNWILGDFTLDSIQGGDSVMLEMFYYYCHTVLHPLVIKRLREQRPSILRYCTIKAYIFSGFSCPMLLLYGVDCRVVLLVLPSCSSMQNSFIKIILEITYIFHLSDGSS